MSNEFIKLVKENQTVDEFIAALYKSTTFPDAKDVANNLNDRKALQDVLPKNLLDFLFDKKSKMRKLNVDTVWNQKQTVLNEISPDEEEELEPGKEGMQIV